MKNSIEHVAVIMDGNGRWAKKRHRPRFWGHVRGAGIVSDIVEAADDHGVKALTLYSFSTENWSRPYEEVNVLFKLLKKFLLKERKRVIDNRIQFKVIGDYTKLPSPTIELIEELTETTRDHLGLKLRFAFGYGARDEIIQATNRFISENPGMEMTEEVMNKYLLTSDLGDVDLIIRTGGDQRISNFLLWQAAYAELFFTPTLWPDFSADEFNQILNSVSNRERRFGGVTASNDLKEVYKKAQNNLSEIGSLQ